MLGDDAGVEKVWSGKHLKQVERDGRIIQVALPRQVSCFNLRRHNFT
jgi:hypothetical protein